MSSDGNKRFSLSCSVRVLALCVALAVVMVDVQASRTGFARSPTDMLRFPELDTGFQLLYQLKFGEARAQFEKWQTSHPEGALGYASEAASYLFEESYRSGILTSDFFLDDKRFLGTTPVKPDPKLREAFLDSNKRAQDVAQFRLKENADNPNALFAMAISLGMQADYAGLIEKHQLDSLKKTREADTYSKKLLKVVPSAYDAYLGLGMANYIIGSLPGSKKFFLGFAGIHGDKKKGIQQLELTAKEGHYLRPFAKVLLALTALREKKPEMARTEFTELVSEFPENPLFAGELAKLNASPAVGTPKAVVDDDESLRGALEGLVKEAGLSVRLFASAEDFLNSGQRHDTRCLIGDIRPGMSGLDLQAQLKAARYRIPIIFITAHGDERIRLQAMRAGAVDFLTKPFDDGMLLEKVRLACLASPVPFRRLNGGDQPESKSLFCLGTMGK